MARLRAGKSKQGAKLKRHRELSEMRQEVRQMRREVAGQDRVIDKILRDRAQGRIGR